MTTYYNPTTGDTAKVNSDKADKNGDVWVEINGGMPEKKIGLNFYQSLR